MANLQSIPTSDIDIVGRLRGAEESQVEAIRASILDVGLLNPISVNEVDGRFRLVAGLHRLEAYKRLGYDEIPAIVLELSDLEAILAECDENLCAPQLTATERATFTAKRKQAYEALHPETKREATLKQGNDLPSRQLGETGKSDRFTADTATKTGQSERAVQRDAERGSKLFPEAADIIRGTKLDTGTYIDRIKNLKPSEQVFAAKRDLRFEAKKERDGKKKPAGGVAARYASTSKNEPADADKFVALVDDLQAIPVAGLIGSGRMRATVGQRASGLIDHLSDLLKGLDA